MTSRGELTLRSGRIVRVQELRQWRFYEGLLEGLPTVEMNRRGLERILADERGKFYGADPLVLPPKETPIAHDGPYRLGVPASLPGIVCVARLDSPYAARDKSGDFFFSGLGVIWFQSDFALPIESGILEQLQSIDWDRYAVDMEY
jgi:hypothetical protein